MRRYVVALLLGLSGVVCAGGAGPRPLLHAFVELTGRSAGDCTDPAQPNLPGCRLRVPLPAVTGLQVGEQRVVVGNNQLSVVYRATPGTREAFVCCGLQLPLSPVPGTDLWGVTARVQDAEKAVMSLAVGRNGNFPQDGQTWRGPSAPAALAVTPVQALRGQVRSLELQATSELTGRRKVWVYTPPGWQEKESLPAVYLADGAAPSMAESLEPLIQAGKAPRVVLVGIENAIDARGQAYDPKKDLRAFEYLKGFEGGQAYFDAHEEFVLKKVIPEIERKYHVQPAPAGRVVAGYSNGAVWAISMGARWPDVFGGVIAMSPGYRPAFAAPGVGVRVFTSGGTLEPPYLEGAQMYAALSQEKGNPTKLVQRVGGHDSIIWQEVFPDAVNFVLEVK